MNSTFKSTMLAVVLSLCFAEGAQAVVTAGEYYIVNDLWGKLLTGNSSNTPRLMAYDENNDAKFIFVAEASGTSGYVKLKQKSTGRYLAASTASGNTWSVQLLSSNGNTDNYLWALDQFFDTKIVNKKNTSARLGSDFYSGSGSNWTYYWDADEIPVYYNKGVGAMTWYSIIPSNGNGFEASRNAVKSAVFTNEYGVQSQQDYQVGEPVDVNGIDYHILSSTPFSGSTSGVNLSGRTSWLVFDNVRPSKVISSYLSKVTIDGSPAVNGQNCRVEIWLRGAAVIPTPSEAPFVATTDNGTFTIGLATGNKFTNLEQNQNKIRSFTLKRGYMVTLATAANGGDYSRVYVADHADLTVTLPTALDKRISSVYVRNWHYVSKAGYCASNDKTDAVWAAPYCGASWAWNWDANKSTSSDVEYIPILTHKWWPSDGNFYRSNSTAMMLINEPEHSEQHTSCSCGGTVSTWAAYEITKRFNATGLRIGSPSATDFSFFHKTENGKEVGYLDYCKNMKQRCDFTCTHGYWTSEWSSNLNTLKSYGRPIWITEWRYGASWTSDSNPNSENDARAKVFDLLEMLEYNNYVERYSYYEFDTGGSGNNSGNGWMTQMFWHNNASEGCAAVGQIYSRIKPHFGYNASVQAEPNWWEPSASTPEIKSAKLQDGKYVLTVNNGNGDGTNTFQILHKAAGSSNWTTVYTITDRAEFEPTKLTITLPSSVVAGDIVKVVLTTLYSNTNVESAEYTIPVTLANLKNMEFNEGTYISSNVRTYAKDITGTDVSGMQQVTGWNIPANGDAHAAGQFRWGASYFLGASGYTPPSTNSEGTTTGGALGINAVWSATTQYIQNVFLEAGTYSFTIPVYNKTGGTTAITKNLFGFIADDGTEYLNTTTTFATNQWTTLTVNFVLSEDTYGKLSVGYTAPNIGYASTPHLFVDYFRINYSTELPSMAALDNLQNLGFDEGVFRNNNIDIGEYNTSQYTVTGWTPEATGNWRSAAQLAWGSGYFLANNSCIIPETNSNGQTDGGALGIVGAWSAQVQYTQTVTLPPGTYTLTIPVYNAGGTEAISNNYFGFKPNSGTAYYATNTTFTEGEWTTMTVHFLLKAETTGKLSVGYKADNKKSTEMPKLFVDYFQISYGGQQWPKSSIGDVTSDGNVDMADVEAIVRYLAGLQNTTFDGSQADVNGDNNITLSDVTALVNIIKE